MTDKKKPEQEHKILVVEDEKHVNRIICDILRKKGGYQVDSVFDGQQALDKLEECNYDYQLVLTDMQMPRLNGSELIDEVLNKRKIKIPFIVLTAHRNDENVVKCLKLGASDYLTKPIKVDMIVRTVRHTFHRNDYYKGEAEELDIKNEIKGWIELTAPTDFEYVERFHRFVTQLGNIPLSEDDKNDIRVAIDEIGQNAVEWGNQNDRNKHIHLSYCLFEDRLVFKIEDEGEGFDPAKVRDPSVDPLAHIMTRMKEGKRAGGYGLFMVRKLMDDIMYNDTGTTVLLTKLFKKKQNT